MMDKDTKIAIGVLAALALGGGLAFRAGELGQGSDGLGAYVMRVRRA